MGVPLFWPEGWDVEEPRLNAFQKCLTPKEVLIGYGYPDAFVDLLNLTADFYPYPCPSQDIPPRPEWFYGSPPTSVYLNYFTVLGGVRLRQESIDGADCPRGTNVYNGVCLKEGQGHGYWLQPDMSYALHMDEKLLDKPRGETVYLDSRETQTNIRQQLRELENNIWVNPHTAKVEVLLPTYNAHLDMITATYILFFFNSGGRIYKRIEPRSMWLKPYHSWSNYFVDIMWLVFVLKIVVEELHDICNHLRKLGIREGFQLYLKFSRIVDWLNVVYSFVLVYYWADHLMQLKDLQDLLDKGSFSVLGTWENVDDRLSFFTLIDETILDMVKFRFMMALYPFVLLSRFFKAFDTQPRLSLVTRTLLNAGVDVTHFAVVFFTVFIIFTVSAMILFGTELLEFVELSRAMNTVFRILLGDFDWDRISGIGRLQAGIWFWTFMWLLNMVMLNMLLAMVMDVYTEVKGLIDREADTLWTQAYTTVRRSWQRLLGRRISLATVLHSLWPEDAFYSDTTDTMMELGDVHTISTLMVAVPALRDLQAERILKAAQKLFEADQLNTQSLAHTMAEIHALGSKLGSANISMQNLFDLVKMSTGVLVDKVSDEGEPQATASSSISSGAGEGGRWRGGRTGGDRKLEGTRDLQ
eukprot:NODE_2885_length_2127_cov_3.454500.p1 GENE.NODE_2885_length_2127_cov_3.454500~~NODE_2885_length_2127_cov_3.454500.p1  ORF type:complete len:640 (-),score=182.18 NODE_2885_length_2127_cov_3.454500:206-2125(-)